MGKEPKTGCFGTWQWMTTSELHANDFQRGITTIQKLQQKHLEQMDITGLAITLLWIRMAITYFVVGCLIASEQRGKR